MNRRGVSSARGVFAVVIWLMAAVAHAQIGAGTLSGTVVDASGAALPGATVTVTNAATAIARTTVTASDGGYAIPGLAPGSYAVRIDLQGFRRVTREGVRLATGETIRVDIALEV